MKNFLNKNSFTLLLAILALLTVAIVIIIIYSISIYY